MSWYAGKAERLTCPAHFQDRLTRVGGLNRYGGPNFKLVWGQTWTVRRAWSNPAGDSCGYKDIVEDGRPCWILKQWYAPEIYGSPTLWFMQNREPNGMQTLGDFPWKGNYETLQPFVWRGMVNGRLVVEYMPLNSMILDMVVPIAIKCQGVTLMRRKVAIQAMLKKKDQNAEDKVEAALHDSRLAFHGPVSFSRQGCRTSIIDKRAHELEKHWNQAMSNVRNMIKTRGMGGVSIA